MKFIFGPAVGLSVVTTYPIRNIVVHATNIRVSTATIFVGEGEVIRARIAIYAVSGD